jgi:two-component system, cell cycle sensor histidine kinase and response regulator CckA
MDDEPMICEILGEALPMFGFEVEFARDGRTAIARYSEAMGTAEAFDAVIMDLRIQGGMGGEEAIERLRHIDPAVRAIVSSGYSDDPIMANHLDHGFCAVLRKPYKILELRDVLTGVLAR